MWEPMRTWPMYSTPVGLCEGSTQYALKRQAFPSRVSRTLRRNRSGAHYTNRRFMVPVRMYQSCWTSCNNTIHSMPVFPLLPHSLIHNSCYTFSSILGCPLCQLRADPRFSPAGRGTQTLRSWRSAPAYNSPNLSKNCVKVWDHLVDL